MTELSIGGMPPVTTPPGCHSCAHSCAVYMQGSVTRQTVCRRFPPVVLATPQGPFVTFVPVADDMICGEFRERMQ